MVLTILLLASLSLGATVALGFQPGPVAVAGPALTVLYLLAGRRVGRRPVRAPVTGPVAVAAARPVPADPAWSGVPFVPVVADWSAGTVAVAASAVSVESADHLVDPPQEATAAVAGTAGVPGSWRAVPVPLPTYVTAPRIARTVSTIDLGSPGAWTSGRTLAPVAPLGAADRDEPGESTQELELPQAATG